MVMIAVVGGDVDTHEREADVHSHPRMWCLRIDAQDEPHHEFRDVQRDGKRSVQPAISEAGMQGDHLGMVHARTGRGKPVRASTNTRPRSDSLYLYGAN